MTLIDRYFNETNLYIPLLHRPTFERSIRDGLHLTDRMFGATVLSVCAIGSLFSDDPRVLLDDVDSPHSAGWKWFRQVRVFQKAIYTRPCIFELQIYCVSLCNLSSWGIPVSSCARSYQSYSFSLLPHHKDLGQLSGSLSVVHRK